MELKVQLKKELFLKQLSFSYDFRALITGLNGTSGAGKTTILKAIAGIEHGEESKIVYQGDVWTDTNKGFHLPVYQRNIGFLMQDTALFPNMNVQENICFSQRTKWKKKQKKQPESGYFDYLISWLGIEAYANQPIQKLSGGQKQRVALARALYSQPDLLLLDEPFTGLDEENCQNALELVKEVIEKEQIPAIVVSHRTSELKFLTDTIVTIH